jgi:predicted transglutaminase-like cysteine proteinase
VALLLLAVAANLAGTDAALAANKKHAPLGYQLMCLQNPDECKGGGAARVAPTKDMMATLKRVNLSVNRSMKPRRDGSVDVWNASASAEGDCEDFVLAKRRQLIRAGLPASALRIAYVKTRSGAGHAVLVVKTGNKEVVLDNLTNAIRPLSQTGYRLVSMQGSNPNNWS